MESLNPFESPIDFQLQIKSDYHSASYSAKNLDTWKYTNSTEVTLRYLAYRLGQLKAIKIMLRGWLFWKHWLDSEIKLKLSNKNFELSIT